MLSAAIFDMDGLLVDSEPFWQQAQLAVLTQLGVSVTLQDTIDTTGVRIDQIVEYYYRKQPWQELTCDEVCNQITDKVIELVKEHQPIMPGVREAIEQCKERGLKVGLASSSPMKLINATLDALSLSDAFEVVESAELLVFGKPHPEVYLNAANSLGVAPTSCMAFEDSFTGLLAAKSAQMKTVVVPAAHANADPRWVISDLTLPSLTEFTREHLESLA